jgi:RHS repeat-associated protein
LYQRTTASSDTVYRYGMGWDPLVEEDGSGYVLGAWAMTPGGARGKKLAYMFGGLNGGLPIYAYHDHLGSIRRTRWTNKSSFGRDEFDPYGGLYTTEGLAFMLRHFAMHPEDPALQAYRAPYRTYSPAMARWMTRDPLGMVDGPNVYAYVHNAPLTAIDKFGLTGLLLDILGYMPWFGHCMDAARAIAQDTMANHSDNFMRHCVGQCELTKQQGSACAAMAGIYHEFLDRDSDSYKDPIGRRFDTLNDLHNNKIGSECGGLCTKKSCAQCCDAARGQGSYIPDDVW